MRLSQLTLGGDEDHFDPEQLMMGISEEHEHKDTITYLRTRKRRSMPPTK